ncbi:hypothetical protein EVAR_4698_1 [Eumeta japonica]|uniref:Uncharacterized protein n=1 Tax=Eumeta variegata TaxID=151549 RepID=A0A4C1WQM3_EUMVA|nr:hypothetical protein EVAR_4698_1 [Eumeta japonica]
MPRQPLASKRAQGDPKTNQLDRSPQLLQTRFGDIKTQMIQLGQDLHDADAHLSIRVSHVTTRRLRARHKDYSIGFRTPG